MCGIVAYIGHRPARPILLEGLKRLEYRGYDSAGMAVVSDDGELQIAKSAGRVSVLEQKLNQSGGFNGSLGIAHTRWATHGEPNDTNAHPHTDDGTRGHGIALIHNGIIENYAALKTYLKEKGHTFTSDTDTEVLTHLIGELYDGDLEAAVQGALREVTGAYAIAVICAEEPDVLVAARKGSPLMVGVGKDEYIVASDSSAIVAHTTQAITLDDYTVARLTRDSFRTTTVDNVPLTPQIRELEFDLDQIELGSYSHYMEKEIHEQPATLRRSLKGRTDIREGQVVLGGIAEYARELVKAKRIIMVGQGTALHAAMVGEYIMEDLAKIPTEVEFASEFRYRNPILEDGTVVIAISQSGETADTLAAIIEAKQRGALALGLVNVVGSTIARETDAGASAPRSAWRRPRRFSASSWCARCWPRSSAAVGFCPPTTSRSCCANSSPFPIMWSRCWGSATRSARPQRVTSSARTGCSSAGGTTIPSRWKARSSSRRSATSMPRACPQRR